MRKGFVSSSDRADHGSDERHGQMSLDCVGECKQKGSVSFLYTFRMFHGRIDAEYELPKV